GGRTRGTLPDSAHHHVHVLPACPPRQLRSVTVPRCAILDLRHPRHATPQRGNLAVHRAEGVVGKHASNRELEQRCPPRNEVTHRCVALVQPQITRVHSLTRHSDVGLTGERLLTLERLQRGLPPCFVPVEREDHFTAERVVVHQQPPQY